MSSRADALRAQADAIEAEDTLAAAMETALAEYRADPSDHNKKKYRDAVQELADNRQLARQDRPTTVIVADIVTNNGEED